MIVSIYKKETSITGSSVISKWRFNSFVHVELKNYISAVLAAAQSIEYESCHLWISACCAFSLIVYNLNWKSEVQLPIYITQRESLHRIDQCILFFKCLWLMIKYGETTASIKITNKIVLLWRKQLTSSRSFWWFSDVTAKIFITVLW